MIALLTGNCGPQFSQMRGSWPNRWTISFVIDVEVSLCHINEISSQSPSDGRSYRVEIFITMHFNGKITYRLCLRLRLAYECDLGTVWKIFTSGHLAYRCGHHVIIVVENCIKRSAILASARLLFIFVYFSLVNNYEKRLDFILLWSLTVSWMCVSMRTLDNCL